jgi:hypothetical protein
VPDEPYGKRLGRLEVAILERVRAQGEPLWAKDITQAIYGKEAEDPPRAFDVSVRRAIHGLAGKKLLCCGEGTLPMMRGKEHNRLICWLPGTPRPDLRATIQGAAVDALVLELVAKAGELADDFDRHYYGFDPQDPALVPYRWILHRAVKRLGGQMIDGRQAVAVNQAARRAGQHPRLWLSGPPRLAVCVGRACLNVAL